MGTSSSYNEKELLRKVAGGDEKAFSELFYQYQALLATHIFRLTESKEMAEEIVQDVFLKIWMTREVLDDIRNFRTYLYVISRNYALNAMRSVVKERNSKKQYEKEIASLQQNEERTLTESQLSLIDKAIEQLPPQQKSVYLLGRKEGLSYEQIARRMNISRETVKYYMKLALASLIRFLRDNMESLPAILVFVILKFPDR